MAGINRRKCCCPGLICSSKSTCNNQCDQSIAELERGPDCECPCEGRLGFIKGFVLNYSVDLITGISQPADPAFAVGTFVATGPDFIALDSYIAGSGECVSPAHPTWTERVDYDDPENEDTDFVNSISVHASWEINTCGDMIRFRAYATKDTGFPSGTGTGTFSGANGIAEADSGWVSRCNESGSVLGTIVNTLVGSSGGELTWASTCTDCNGDPFIIDNGEASICADIVSITGVWWNGTEYITETIAFGPNASIRTDERVDEKCCPERIAKDCTDCNAPADGDDCQECWEVSIVRYGNTLKWWGRGSCPQSAPEWKSVSDLVDDGMGNMIQPAVDGLVFGSAESCT